MNFQILRRQVRKSIKELNNLKLQSNKLMRQEKDIGQLLLELLYYSFVF